MAEENQETMKGPKEVITIGPKEVTTKDPRRVEQGKKLQEWNHRNKEELKAKKSANQYGIGVALAVGAIGGLGYYLYQAKVNAEPPQRSCPKFEMD